MSETIAEAVDFNNLPDMDGWEVSPGIFIIGQPSPAPERGRDKMVALANVEGMLALIEIRIKPKQEVDAHERR
jgi:hypothetical protein